MRVNVFASECVNAILKNKVEYKRSELPMFIQNLKEVASDQRKSLKGQLSTREISN